MMRKPRKDFWNKEYEKSSHLALSTDPSEDLEKFMRFLEREYDGLYLNKGDRVLDLGCGNGRNLVYLAKKYGISGVGYDSSREAIGEAHMLSHGLALSYEVRSIAWDIPLPDASQDLVLDMMASHFLRHEEREKLRHEIRRVLKPGGWFFYKTFLLDEDAHASRMLREHPADEPGSYVHPEIGVLEHVSREEEVTEAFSPLFTIHKALPSHGHLRTKAKRRSISVYMQKER
jgi:SAM-dependent methyltransferase